jgi:CHAD domain-containing protein
VTVEWEAKLIPTDGFRWPALEKCANGLVVVSEAVRELDATYYDTPELELARWGITLRHRRGEPGRPWTLKLPAGAVRAVIAREELTFEGPVDSVPDEARDLIRCFARDRPLQVVASLHTTRVPTDLRDADGHTLVEIVDDSVVVSDGASEIDRFREIEVEVATDSPRGHAALQSAVAVFVDAGCRTERPLPKLVRALGRRAHEAPSVVVEPVGRKASPRDLLRHLTATSVIQILMHDPGVRIGLDPEDVHAYRVAARRLRSDLRTFARVLDDGPTGDLRAELRWLGRVVGPVRDLDVLAARFTAHSRDLSELDQPAVTEILTRLATARHNARRDLLEALRSERYDRVIRVMIEFASDPPIDPRSRRKAGRPADALARRLVARRWKEVAAAVTAGGAHPTDLQLHQIRIAAKRCRYATEAVAPVLGHSASRFATAVENIQTVLGDYHDTVVAEAWLRDMAVEVVDSRVAIGGLIATERQARARLREAWPRAWRRASKREALARL